MITLDTKKPAIVISEEFTFEKNVKSTYLYVKNNIKSEYNNLKNKKKLYPLETENLKNFENFINYQLNTDDIIEILEYILEQYNKRCNFDDNISLYNTDMIETCIKNWIANNFNIIF